MAARPCASTEVRAETWHAWSVESVELVERAIRDHATFKAAIASLRERPTDDRAVETLLEAYREGRAPAWLTAVLLGALRAEAAYDFVRNMLETMHGQMVESYAAGAMVEIRGERAQPDLVHIAWHASDGRTRQAAAGAIRGREKRATLLALSRAGRIDPLSVSFSLARDGVDETWLRELLSSDADVDLRIGTEVLSSWLHNGNVRSALALRKSVGATVERVLALPDFRMAPWKRRFLIEWLAGKPLPGR